MERYIAVQNSFEQKCLNETEIVQSLHEHRTPTSTLPGWASVSICLNTFRAGEVTTLHASSKHCWKAPFVKKFS